MTALQRETAWNVGLAIILGWVFFAFLLPAFRVYVLPGLTAWATGGV